MIDIGKMPSMIKADGNDQSSDFIMPSESMMLD